MKLLAVGLVLLALVTATSAQAQALFGISYGMAVGTGNTNDFIDKYSWRGMGLDFRQFITREATLGFHIGWNVLNKETVELASVPAGDVFGKQFRYMNAFPFLFEALYHWGKQGGTRPYVGGALGPYRIEQRVELGLFAVEERNWHFGLAPEAGVLLPISFDSFWFINARWNYAFKSGNVEDQSWWGINIGISSDTDVF